MPTELVVTRQGKYRVLIADDHGVVRIGLRSLLESMEGIVVCGEASTAAETIERAKRERPDLVLLDLRLPDGEGIEVLEVLRAEIPETDVLIVSMYSDPSVVEKAIASGACGYLLKSDSVEDLHYAVDLVRKGEIFLSKRFGMKVTNGRLEYCPRTAGRGDGVPLTLREREVLKLLVNGKTNRQVARLLAVSTRTIDTHRSHMMSKLQLSSFSDLIKYAMRSAIVVDDVYSEPPRLLPSRP